MPSTSSPPSRVAFERPFEGEAGFRSVLGAIGSVVVCLSPDHRILEWNPEAARLYGRSREEVLGKNYLELFVPEDYRDLVAADIRKVLAGEPTDSFENPVHIRGGATRLVLWNVRPILGRGLRPIGIIACGQDITARKRAEQHLKESRQQLRALSDHIEEVREEERTRLARQIHDELGQALTAITIDLSWLEDHLQTRPQCDGSPKAIEKIQELQALSSSTIDVVRQIATSLRPAMLDDLGLVATMEWETKRFGARCGIACRSALDLVERDLNVDIRTAVYRIFMEALTNVARHAHARRVDVRLAVEDHTVVLVIEDDGVGILSDQVEHAESLGILGMRERAHRFGGEIGFATRRGRGTRLVLRIPLKTTASPDASEPGARPTEC